MRSSLVSTALLLAMLRAPVANADPPAKADLPARRAAAAALFQQGINAMQAGKMAEGCDKLAASVATMPDSGAMGALAECNTAIGRLSEAWDLWRDLATSAPTAELRDDAAKNAAALDKRLARVAIHLRGTAPSDLVVTLNGKPVRAVDATEHRVTPGALVVVAAAPEIERWTQTFEVKQGATVEIEIPVAASQGELRRRSRVRWISWSLVGAGTIAVGIGAAYGSMAYSDWHAATASCGGNADHCKSAGYASASSQLVSARREGTISTWSTAIGLGTVVTGLSVYLLLRNPTRTEPALAWRAAPMAGPQAVGIVLTRSLP